MRLIDADALRESLDKNMPRSILMQTYNRVDIIRTILDAPTIEVETLWSQIEEPDCRICAQSSCRHYHETRKPGECGSYVRYEPTDYGKHEPVKPIWTFSSSRTASCGACNASLPDRSWKFCPWCGRELDWFV